MRDSQGKLPSQTVINPNANVSAVTLRSEGAPEKESEEGCQEDPPYPPAEGLAKNPLRADPLRGSPADGSVASRGPTPRADPSAADSNLPSAGKSLPSLNISISNTLLPLPSQVKAPENKVIRDAEVPDDIQQRIPPKCGDPGTFTIPCTIGNLRIDHCMLDLGASINMLPYALYRSLNIGPLSPTNFTIQLADKSCKKPEGIVANVLVRVGKLVFLADFYVLKMRKEGISPVLLGRPFMMTARTKIDVYTGLLSMEVDEEVIHFNIYNPMKSPPNPAGIHDTMEQPNQNEVVQVHTIIQNGAADSRTSKPPDKRQNSASKSRARKKKSRYRKRRKRKDKSPNWIRADQQTKGERERHLMGSASWSNR